MKPKAKLFQVKLTGEIIGAAIEVHRQLGPGLLESTYQPCLARELELRGVFSSTKSHCPWSTRAVRLDCGYRIELLVASSVVVEVKSVEALAPIHEAQLLTYLKLTGVKIGLLMNFNVVVLKSGIRRLVH